MENTTTLWKPCPGFETVYKVSDTGSVQRILQTRGTKAGSALKPFLVNGYLGCGLHAENVKRTVYVHRLVCEAFHGPASVDKPYALHRDGSRDNNHAANLYWGSQKDNLADSAKHGVMRYGQDRKNTVLTETQVREIRARAENGEKYRAIAKDYPVCRQTIEQIVHRQRWSHI
jgi:hypothetical protein